MSILPQAVLPTLEYMKLRDLPLQINSDAQSSSQIPSKANIPTHRIAAHYPGSDADLPAEVFFHPVGEVIRQNGTSVVSMILRHGHNTRDCNEACLVEDAISCHYFRYLESRHKCLLLSSLLSKTSQTSNTKEESTANQEENKDFDLNAVLKKTGNQEVKNQTKKKELDQIKPKSKLAQIISTVGNVSQKGTDIDETVAEIWDHEKRNDRRIEKLQRLGGNLSGGMKELASEVNNLETDLSSVKLANEEIVQHLSNSETNNPVIDRELAGIKRSIAELKSKVEMNPTVFKITKNQRVLAEALESIDRELTVFERKLSHIDDTSDDVASRLTKEELHRKTLNGALQTLTNAVRTIRKDVDKLENPMSSVNTKKASEIAAIKSDINVLGRSNTKLVQDMRKTRSELTNLLKDLMNVQEGHQESKTSITALVEANRGTRQDYLQLKRDQDQMMSKIQTLATVYRTVLTALHNLEIKQIKVVHKLDQYDITLRKLNADFLGNKVLSGSGSKKWTSVSKNLTEYSNLLKSQRSLYRQMMRLQNELTSLKMSMGIHPQHPHKTVSSHNALTTQTPPLATGKGKLDLIKRMKVVHRLHSLVKQHEDNLRAQRWHSHSKQKWQPKSKYLQPYT